MKIEYQPIGVVHSPFVESEGTPIQPSRAKNAAGTVKLLPEFVEGLSDLDGFSHIILLCHMHKTTGYRLKVTPYLDTQPRGLFATRAPSRPNPIGLSVVELVGIEGNQLSIHQVPGKLAEEGDGIARVERPAPDQGHSKRLEESRSDDV